MKKFALIVSLGIIFLSFFSLYSCKKDRSMEVIITVKLFEDTSKLIPNARVELYQEDVEVVGYTNGYGEFRYTFELPMQVNVSVTKDTLAGIGVLNIGTYGEEIRKTVYVF